MHHIHENEYSLNGYDRGYPGYSPLVQTWLGEGHEEGSFVLVEGTQEAAGTEYNHEVAMDSSVQPVTNSEKKVNHS